MSIINWFTNDLTTEERSLTRDLISVAIADKQFLGREKQMIMDICKIEDISSKAIMDSIRDKFSSVNSPKTLEEKQKYLMHLVQVMAADGDYTEMEMHIIEIIAKQLEVKPMQLLSFILDDINDGNIGPSVGMSVIDKFVKYFIVVGG